MKRIQVRMMRNHGLWERGSTPIFQANDAMPLIVAGIAVPLNAPAPEPQEIKPVGPSETKPFAPSEVKAEDLSKKKLRKRSS